MFKEVSCLQVILKARMFQEHKKMIIFKNSKIFY